MHLVYQTTLVPSGAQGKSGAWAIGASSAESSTAQRAERVGGGRAGGTVQAQRSRTCRLERPRVYAGPCIQHLRNVPHYLILFWRLLCPLSPHILSLCTINVHRFSHHLFACPPVSPGLASHSNPSPVSSHGTLLFSLSHHPCGPRGLHSLVRHHLLTPGPHLSPPTGLPLSALHVLLLATKFCGMSRMCLFLSDPVLLPCLALISTLSFCKNC